MKAGIEEDKAWNTDGLRYSSDVYESITVACPCCTSCCCCSGNTTTNATLWTVCLVNKNETISFAGLDLLLALVLLLGFFFFLLFLFEIFQESERNPS